MFYHSEPLPFSSQPCWNRLGELPARLNHGMFKTLLNILTFTNNRYYCKLCNNPAFSDSLNVQRHERVGLLSVQVAVIKQDLFTAHHYILQSERHK